MPGRSSDTSIAVNNPNDIVSARRACREAAMKLGFGSADQTRLATAVSELARNLIQYAGGGICHIGDSSNETMLRICIVVEDFGPGIPDVDRALEDGFSTSGGLGAGLPGTRRLVDTFVIDTQPGHTLITITLAKARV